MGYIDLKQTNLEKILSSLDFSNKEITRLKEDSKFYDRYILIQHGSNIGFLTIHQQHFNDPYLELKLDDCDIINYKGKIPLKKFIDVMDNIFRAPQITRCLKSDLNQFKKRGFREIEERKPEASTLIKVLLDLYEVVDLDSKLKDIRKMKDEDITEIKQMFSEEYAARYLDIARLYKKDPKSCFVYEEKGKIKGVILNERMKGALYSHQLKVRNSDRKRGIDLALLSYTNNYALSLGYDKIKGSIRGNLLPYYLKIGVKELKEPSEQYIIRFKI